MTTLFNTTMGKVSFSSKIPMVDGLVNIDGMMIPMDFVEYLPLNVEFEYYCNYGIYIEQGTFKLINQTTELKFPINKLEYNDDINMVELTVNISDPNAIISIYPVQLVELVDGNLDLLPKIEVINGSAMVPEIGIWIVMVDIPGKATTTKQFETNGNDVEVDIPIGGDTGGDTPEVKCHLQVNISPISAKVELKIGDTWETRNNNYFENLEEGTYLIRCSNIGYITYERTVNITSGTNTVNITLIKENSDGSEVVVVPDGKLPPVSYDEIYINNIDDFKLIRIIPLTCSCSFPDGYMENNAMWNNISDGAQYSPNLANIDMNTGLIKFNKDHELGVWVIEAIPNDNIKYHKSTAYIDLYNMNYKYLDIELVEREKTFNLRCKISNPEECDKFHSYSISYETADMNLNSGILAMSSINEEINVTIPVGTYTIIATLYDNDGMEVKVPITPENFTPHEDLDISLKYNDHIKVKFKPEINKSRLVYLSFSSDNAPNLLTSSIFDQYGYDSDTIIRNSSLVEPFNTENTDEYSVYIRPNGGNVKLLYSLVHPNISGVDMETYAIESQYINISNINHGSIIELQDLSYTEIKETFDAIYRDRVINNVLKYTPSAYKSNNTIYHGLIGQVYYKDESPFINTDNITESNIHSHIVSGEFIDAKYKLQKIYSHGIGNDTVSFSYNTTMWESRLFLHDEVIPIFPNKTVNLTINTNIPDSDIIVCDINSGLYKSISSAGSYYGFPSIYKGKGTFNGEILDNCVYSATIYKSGFAIKTFTFSAIGEDIIINKNIDPLIEWDNNISAPPQNITDTTDIEFDIVDGSNIEIISIEPHYNTMSFDGNIIRGVPAPGSYKINAIYTPPKNKVINNPINLTFGGVDDTRVITAKEKKTIIVIDKNTGIDPIKCNISLDKSNSPNIMNKKIIIYHNGKKESIELSKLPKTIDLFGYSDMYLELYDNDKLISKNMFFISHEHSDIIIRVPNKQMVPITVKPFTKIKNRAFIAWEEKDPYIAPYYGSENINKYTKYDKIEYGHNNTIRYLYGSIGDTIKYKLFIDGYYPYEGSVQITDNTIIDLDNIALPKKGNAFKYYGTITPNSEYAKYKCNYEVGSNLKHKIMEGPIISWYGTCDHFGIPVDIKYNIPMFIETGNEYDIQKFEYEHRNTLNWIVDDGYVRLYNDKRPKKSAIGAGIHYNSPATAGKYPFVVTNGGLLSNTTSIYDTLFKQSGGIYSMPQETHHSSHAYLYPGRYKYFTSSGYGTSNLHSAGTVNVSGANDIIVYSAGDIVIRKGINYIESNHINNTRKPPSSSYGSHHKVLVASLSEINQAQYHPSGGWGSYDEWVVGASSWKDYRFDGVKIVNNDRYNDISYSIKNSIKIFSFKDADTVTFADVSEFVEGDKDFETKFINLSTKSDKNKDMVFKINDYGDYRPLTADANTTIIKNIRLHDYFYLTSSDHSIVYTTRMYGFMITGNEPNLPIYYKIPHGDIVIIRYEISPWEIDGISYDVACIYAESPIPYGMSYNKDSLNKTIITLYDKDSAMVSGTFPMKINIKGIGIGMGGAYDNYPYYNPDIVIEGYFTITEDNAILQKDGTYEYLLTHDDITIVSKEVLSDRYSSYIFDPDGRAYSGEFDMEIVEANQLSDVDDIVYGHNDKFVKVDFNTKYILRKDADNPIYPNQLREKTFYIRYIDKVTKRSYLSGVGSTLTTNYEPPEHQINPRNTIRILLTSFYKNDNIDLGVLKTSNVSLIGDISNIKRVYLVAPNYIVEIKDFNNVFKVPYGLQQLYIVYEDGRYNYTTMKYIDSEETKIELDKPVEIPYNDIKVGGYRISTSIEFSEEWNVEILGEYRSTNKYMNSMPVGVYKYVARSYGYKPVYGEFEVIENQTTYVDIEFEKEDIIEFGTVIFKTNPSSAIVYIKNESGNYVRIRSDKMSIYLPYGEYDYIVKRDYYQDYIGKVNINDSYVTVNVEMTVKPTPTYLITFNLINPRHGVTTKVSINNGDWFEAREITVKQYDLVSWLAEADGFERAGGSFRADSDSTIDIDLSRGNGTLYVDNIPRNMRFYLEMEDKNGEKYWIEPFMNYIYIDIPRKEYNYKVAYRGDYAGVKTYKERFGTLKHYNNITNFDASCEINYGFLNISVNIDDYELYAVGYNYPFNNEIPLSAGMTEVVSNMYTYVTCVPRGKYEKYLPIYKENIRVNAGETVNVDFVFGKEQLMKHPIYLTIYPTYGKYKVEVYSDGGWTTIEESGSQSNVYDIGAKPEGDTTRVRISGTGYITQDITLKHSEDGRSKSINMEEIMEGGYMYPLYPSTINDMRLSYLNRDKEIYEKYKHIKYNGVNFGKLPVTGDSPIIVRINANSFPVAIDADRRESFITMEQPDTLIHGHGYYSNIELDGSNLIMPNWADDSEVYTFKFEFFGETYLGKNSVKRSEVTYRVTKNNSGRNNTIMLSQIQIPSDYSIRVTVTKSNGDCVFVGRTIPSKSYTVHHPPIKMYPTFKQNGYYRIVFTGSGELIPGVSKLYFYLENPGNVISKSLGQAEEGKWVDVEKLNELEYEQPMIRKTYNNRLILKYIYREEGYKYMMGEIDVTDKIQSYPLDNVNINITGGMIREELLKYGREKINDPVKVTFERPSHGTSRHLNYKIYRIGLPPYDDIKDVSIDVTGATLEFERGTAIAVETSGALNIVQAFILNQDNTIINAETMANDGYMSRAVDNPDHIAGDNYNSIRIKFNIAKYNPNNPSTPIQNLKLDEFDEIIIMAITEDDKYYIYRLRDLNTNTIRLPQTPIIHIYSMTFRKKGYNTIYLPIALLLQGLDESSTPREISLPVLHPVTE